MTQVVTPVRRVIVTGQIGCGKTTLAQRLSVALDAPHMPLDQFNGLDDAHTEASQLIERMPDGWIVDGCVWQVPPSVWALADVAVHLDYSNALHYRRIMRRAVRRCFTARRWSQLRVAVTEEREHLQLMRRHADDNRSTWRAAGGITAAPIKVVTCRTPAAANEFALAVCTQF